MAAAFLALSAGLLVHYSAGPYCLLLGLHYLLRVFWKRPRKWRQLAAIVVPCALLLATWFAWSVAVYGRGVTFQSNTSVTSARQYPGNNLAKIGANLADSIVPYVLRNGLTYTGQTNPTGILRDNAFGFYQLNLIFGMGLVGGPFVVWLLWGFVRRRAAGVVAGCFVDFSLGVFLQARLEAFENTSQRTVFTTGLNLGYGAF
jgi:hypothetical protein